MNRICLSLFLMLFLVFTTACNLKTSQSYRIGIIAPLTGNQAFIGQDFKEGMELAAEEVQARGEKLDLIFEDSQGEVKIAVSVYQKLMTNPPDIFISVNTGDEALLELAQNDKIPIVLTVSSTSGLPAKGGYVFRYFTNADVDAPVMATYAVQNLSLKRFGVLYLLDNFGISYKDVFKKTVKALGEEVIASESYQYEDMDYRTQLTKIKDKKIDGLYIIGLDYQIIEALKEIKELGFNTTLLSVGTIATKYALSLANNTAEGMYMTAFCTDQTPAAYQAKFRAKYNKEPGFFGELGYDILQFIDFASKGGKVSREGVKQNLLAIQDFESNSGRVHADATGELIIPVCPKVVRKGKIFNLVTGRVSEY